MSLARHDVGEKRVPLEGSPVREIVSAPIHRRAAGVTNGVLVILPAPTEGVSAGSVIAGLPLLSRIVLAAERAGLRSLPVGVSRSDVDACDARTQRFMFATDGPTPSSSAPRIVLLAMTVIPRPDWLRDLLEMPLEAGRLYTDRQSAALIQVENWRSILAVVSRAPNFAAAAAALGRTFETVECSFDDRGRFRVFTARDLPAAEAWLLYSLIKPNEGIMSRHFERRVSLALTRRLCRTRITPNAITLVSLIIGLASVPFFLSSAPLYQVVGALLFLWHSILDGCDGELARLKFLESRWGAIFDIAGDNLVHVTVFAAMAVGWSRHAGATWPLVLGAITIISTLTIVVIVFGRGMRASTEGAPASGLARVADAVIYRDFIYLILMLAIVGKAHWFLALTSVGAPAFVVLLAWLGRRRQA